jgi:LPXTG-motif cell wall-anchored protein
LPELPVTGATTDLLVVFGLLAIAIASLLLFGDPASINAWGLWLQGILEAVR